MFCEIILMTFYRIAPKCISVSKRDDPFFLKIAANKVQYIMADFGFTDLESSSTAPLDTVAALRSRVDQQSTLIAMLKQRGDSTLSEVITVEYSLEKEEGLDIYIATTQCRIPHSSSYYLSCFFCSSQSHRQTIRFSLVKLKLFKRSYPEVISSTNNWSRGSHSWQKITRR